MRQRRRRRGNVGENNFRDIGLVASSSSFSRIFTFHSPLKSAIEFHHRIPPPPWGREGRERRVSTGGQEKKKSPFSILVSTGAGTKNGETTLLPPLQGRKTTIRKRNYSANVSLPVPPVAKPKTTPNRESEKGRERGRRKEERNNVKGWKRKGKRGDPPFFPFACTARCDDCEDTKK